MKVIFLDIDGVLNSMSFLMEAPEIRDRIDPAAVMRINRIAERSGAKIVVSSTWRLKYTLDELRARLAEAGLRSEIIGRTPEARPSRELYADPCLARCEEIQAWIDAQPEMPESYVVLDDADLDGVAANLVKTDFTTGLLDTHIDAALSILGEST